MREILFSGKRADNGEWIEGTGINTQYDVRGEKHTYIGVLTRSQIYPSPMQTITWYEVILETVVQYTGLTDKNGKKIFEGDICQHRSYYSDNIVISVVTYTDGHFLAMVDENSGFELSDKLEVIGNIHDNPELLKGGERDGKIY